MECHIKVQGKVKRKGQPLVRHYTNNMKIPKKIKVAGHIYKIKWDNKRLSDDGYVGESDHHLDMIYLCRYFKREQPRTDSEIEETFIHEILHAIDVNYNNHALSEKEVTRLAVGLHQVLKDNFNL